MSEGRKKEQKNKKASRNHAGNHALVSLKSIERMRRPQWTKHDDATTSPSESKSGPPVDEQELGRAWMDAPSKEIQHSNWPTVQCVAEETASEPVLETSTPKEDVVEASNSTFNVPSDPFDDSEDIKRRMKSAYLAALSAAERDAQLQAKRCQQMEEQKRAEEMAIEYERRRLEELRKKEDVEKERKTRERKGGEIIRKQIEEHEQQKAIEAERIESEKKEALRRMQLEMEETERAIACKEAKKREEMEEMKRTNAMAIEAKQKALEEEMEMDRAARVYLEEAQRREEELEAQMKAERLAREEEINKLRKAQMEVTKAVSDREEMLVKKAIANAEKAWKEQQVEEAAKKKAMAEELRLARAQYIEHKARLEAEAAQRRKEIQLEYQKEEEEMKQAIEANRQKFLASKEEYRCALTDQLNAKSQAKRQEALSNNQEAETFFKSCEKKKQSLESIKEAMIQDLTRRGVPAEYTSLLSRVQV